jgi:polyisoprenyl-teichoic acid--peptidoglycan teichoic acid transferase
MSHEMGGSAACPDSATSDRKVAAVPQPGPVVLQSRPLPSGDRPHPRRPPPAPIPLLAAFLSALVPGLGQLYTGRRRLGAVALATTASLLLVAMVASRLGPIGLLPLLLRPSVLVALLALNVGLTLLRLGCVVDAFRSAQLRRGPPPGGRYAAPLVGLAVIAAGTVAPHVAAGYYDVQAHRLVRSIAGAPTSSATAWLQRDRVSVLLLGGDAGPGRVGLRTDTMIVASVQRSTGAVTLFGLPRNLTRVPMPDRAAVAFACRCFPNPLNALYGWARAHPELFPGRPDAGAAALMGAVERLLGIPIDHYALVDLSGFVDVIDALGGVTVDVAERVRDRLSPATPGGPWRSFDIRPGRQHLDGESALAYARSRHATSDYDRMRRQRCLLAAVAGQADPPTLLRALPRLVPLIERSVSTDIPVRDLPALAGLAAKARRDRVGTVGLTPPRFAPTRDAAGYPIVDVPAVRAAVSQALEHPEAARTDARTTASRCG